MVAALKRENERLKQLVAELSLQNLVLKKNGRPRARLRPRYARMEAGEKAALIALVRASPLPRKQVLAQLGLPKCTYYGWRRRRHHRPEGLGDWPSGPRVPWNRIRPEEEQAILALARASPGLSPRELALQLTDTQAFSVVVPSISSQPISEARPEKRTPRDSVPNFWCSRPLNILADAEKARLSRLVWSLAV